MSQKVFTRLGKPNELKKRTLKVVMKTKQEKEDVLANLKLLKSTVEEFGKISVTDDYTSHEREQIKSWVKIAAEKSEEDSDKKQVMPGFIRQARTKRQ